MERFEVLIRYGRKDKKGYEIDAKSEEDARQWAENQVKVKGWLETKIEVKQK